MADGIVRAKRLDDEMKKKAEVVAAEKRMAE
jgi:hypothetical protein